MYKLRTPLEGVPDDSTQPSGLFGPLKLTQTDDSAHTLSYTYRACSKEITMLKMLLFVVIYLMYNILTSGIMDYIISYTWMFRGQLPTLFVGITIYMCVCIIYIIYIYTSIYIYIYILISTTAINYDEVISMSHEGGT